MVYGTCLLLGYANIVQVNITCTEQAAYNYMYTSVHTDFFQLPWYSTNFIAVMSSYFSSSSLSVAMVSSFSRMSGLA